MALLNNVPRLGLVTWIALTATGLAGQTESNTEIGARFANGIAAIVEDRIITVGDIRREIEPLLAQLRIQSRTPAEFRQNVEQIEDEVIQNLVDQVLIVKDFYSDEKRRIPANYIDQDMAEELMTTFEGDRSKFLSYLRAIGKTQKEYRRLVEDRIIVNYMRGQMRKSQNVVSPARIENFYVENRDRFYQGDGVHLRMIRLARIADESQSVLQQTADTIMNRLRKGGDFGELAKEFSQDPHKKQGGDWGWIARSDLREELADAAFALEKGSFTEPLVLDGEIFILFVEDKRMSGIQPLEEVRGQIENMLVSQMAREAQDRWLERLRRTGYVRYFN